MRTFVLILATLAFVAGLIIEPAALLQIVRICLRGYCGVRPLWIVAGSAAIVVTLVVAVIMDRREPPPLPPPPSPRRKPRTKPNTGTMLVKNVPPRSRRVKKP